MGLDTAYKPFQGPWLDGSMLYSRCGRDLTPNYAPTRANQHCACAMSRPGYLVLASVPGPPSFRAIYSRMTFDPAEKSGGRAWYIFSRDVTFYCVKVDIVLR